MRPAPTRRALTAVLATAVGAGVLAAVPAAAHNPRETPPGAPRMDLEVLVTPELEGRITPGGTDPLVSVDGLGNRFAVARKEDAQTAAGVDPRAGTAVRTAAWAWTSADDGLTWDNLETVTRGLDALLPQGVGRDLASAGPLTAVAESHGGVVVVTRVLAQRKGQLVGQTPTAVRVLGGAPGAPSLAVTPTAALLAAPLVDGDTTVLLSDDAGASFTAGPELRGACEVAADPRPGSSTWHAACAEGTDLVLHRSDDGGRTFERTVLGARDGRTGPARPQLDVGPDGTPYALSGTRLVRLVGDRPVAQDLALPPGDVHGVSFAVSALGRVAAAAHHRAAPGAPWHVQVALFDPGAQPAWYDFADHDPVAPAGAAAPAAASTSVDTDPQGRLQLVWGATFLQSAELGRPLLRNVFSARSVTT